MVVEWFCQVMGTEVGPLNQRQLVDMVRQHQVNPEDLVRRNNSAWIPAFEVKGLFEAAAKPPAKKTVEQDAETKASADSKQTAEPQTQPAKTQASQPAQHSQAQTQASQAQQSKTVASKSTKPRRWAEEKGSGQTTPEKSTRVDAAHKPNAEDSRSEDWFCIASGEKKGPLGFDELKRLASDGTLRGKDRVWRAAWPKFQKAAEVDGLEPTQ